MNTTTDGIAIEHFISAYNDAINASDVSKTLTFFTADGVLMPNGSPLSRGQEQLGIAYETLYKAFKMDVKYTAEEVIVAGDFAYARTSSKGKALNIGSGEAAQVENKELFVLRKENGQWKIAQYIFNNNKR